MPWAQYEALEARCQAQRERGIASDKGTNQCNNDDEEEEREDLNDPPELSLIEARVHQETIDIFQSAILFSQGAAQALYDDQMIMTLDVLRELDDKTIKDIAHTIKKPGGDAQGLQISELSVY